MSRGGRGGARGGRGRGRGGGAMAQMPWGDEVVDGKPSVLFPPYLFPMPREMTELEEKHVHGYRLLRQNVNDSPFYTQSRGGQNPQQRHKIYFSDQRRSSDAGCFGVDGQKKGGGGAGGSNALIGKHSNPFADMETYSSRFRARERRLPDFSARPFSRRIFETSLQTVLPRRVEREVEVVADGDGDEEEENGGEEDGEGVRRPAKRRRKGKPPARDGFGAKRLNVRGLGTLRNAGEVLRGDEDEDFQERWKRLEAEAEFEEEKEKDGGAVVDLDDEDDVQPDEEDYAYDEDEEGDYNAEAYFDDGEMDGDDGDDGGDDGYF